MTTGFKQRSVKEEGAKGGRPFIGIKTSAASIAWLDKIADQTKTSRAAVVRACIVVARARVAEVKAILKEGV